MAFPDYDYDEYEDFEDALGGNWSEVDTNGIIDPADTAAKYSGSKGLSVDHNGEYEGWVKCAFAGKTEISVGFWIRTTHDWSIYPVDANNSGSGTVCSIRSWEGNIIIAGTGNIEGPALVDDTWYWVTFKAVKNDTCTARVYNEAHAQVGNDFSCTGNNFDIDELLAGTIWTDDLAETTYIDDIVIDFTDATFPLLGWETGDGEGSIVPLILNQDRRRRS